MIWFLWHINSNLSPIQNKDFKLIFYFGPKLEEIVQKDCKIDLLFSVGKNVVIIIRKSKYFTEDYEKVAKAKVASKYLFAKLWDWAFFGGRRGGTSTTVHLLPTLASILKFFFCLLLFEGTFTLFFKDKNS